MQLRFPSGLADGVDRLVVPGDKSIAHRALWCAALARGESRLFGVPVSDDVAATRGVLDALGVRVATCEPALHVVGCGGEWPVGDVSLDIGASGTTLRLLCGLLAAGTGDYRVRVAAQLGRRPIAHVLGLLRAMGAEIVAEQWGTPAAEVRIQGRRLRGIRCALPVASAQLKCALLLAAVQAEAESQLCEPIHTRDHLERMLPAFGGRLSNVPCPTCTNGGAGGGVWLRITPGPFSGTTIQVPGDISSASIWIAMGLLLRQRPLTLAGVGLNPTRLGLVCILQRMGAQLVYRPDDAAGGGGEPCGDLVVHPSALRGTEVSPSEVPACIDELPLLIALAGLADGRTTLRGLAALRTKESDRLQHTVAACRAAGMQLAAPDGDTVQIDGRPTLQVRPQTFPRTADHRMVMLFTLLALLARSQEPSIIPDADAVSKSYPGFWADFRALWPDCECESF